MSLAPPQMGMHISLSSKSPHPNITTHSGQLPQPWRKMHRVNVLNAHVTPATPHPLPYNLLLTTPLRAHMPKDFDLQIHLKLSPAHAAPHSAHPNTSHGGAHCSIKHVLTTPSTPMDVPSPTPPSITHTPTNYLPSSKIAMLLHALLRLAPLGKFLQNLTKELDNGSR
jgi:hypothetical protein